MTTKRRILQVLEQKCGDQIVDDVRIGLGYTAVRLDDDRTGVAYMISPAELKGCNVFSGMRPLSGRPVREFLKFLVSDNLTEASLGLAAANALANTTPPDALPGDVLHAVEILPSDRVGMVGFFGPLVPTLKESVMRLEVFESDDSIMSDLLNASEALNRLPYCDVTLITSTAIINNTIDALLEASVNCRETVLLGSSTPLLPEAFYDTAVTWLSGITVDDPAGILKVISEGGGTRFFKPFVTKWNLNLKRA